MGLRQSSEAMDNQQDFFFKVFFFVLQKADSMDKTLNTPAEKRAKDRSRQSAKVEIDIRGNHI